MKVGDTVEIEGINELWDGIIGRITKIDDIIVDVVITGASENGNKEVVDFNLGKKTWFPITKLKVISKVVDKKEETVEPYFSIFQGKWV